MTLAKGPDDLVPFPALDGTVECNKPLCLKFLIFIIKNQKEKA